MYEGVEVELYKFLSLSLDADEGSATISGRFTPENTAKDTCCVG
jgi:hypothetical protein